jgi:hypothetical protein
VAPAVAFGAHTVRLRCEYGQHGVRIPSAFRGGRLCSLKGSFLRFTQSTGNMHSLLDRLQLVGHTLSSRAIMTTPPGHEPHHSHCYSVPAVLCFLPSHAACGRRLLAARPPVGPGGQVRHQSRRLGISQMLCCLQMPLKLAASMTQHQ